MSQLVRVWYLSHRRPAKAQASLQIRVVLPEPSLFVHMKNGRPKMSLQPDGRWHTIAYCFWCRSCRHLHRHSFLSALYLLNQLVDFDQTGTDTLVGQSKFWWPWPHFWRSHQHFECQILTKKACLHPISWIKRWIQTKLYVWYHWDS